MLLAGLSVAVVPALRPTLIDGVATAVPIPGLPSVGDCVTEPIPYSSLWISLHNPPTDGTVVYPALTIEPCDGPRYGEVVAVIPAPVVVTVQVDGQNWSVNDRNRDTCWSASASYLGIPGGTADLQWVPLVSAPSLVSQPLPRQHAAGQNWLACLTYVQSGDTVDPGTTVAPYTGTLRDAATTGNQTNRLGYCGDDAAALSGGDGGCERPHRYQQLAIAPTGASRVSAASTHTTCTDTANVLVGRDVTSSGDLEVVVTVADDNGLPVSVDGDVPPNATLHCTIAATGGRLLTGSVIGLGDRPIPWA